MKVSLFHYRMLKHAIMALVLPVVQPPCVFCLYLNTNGRKCVCGEGWALLKIEIEGLGFSYHGGTGFHKVFCHIHFWGEQKSVGNTN